MERDEGREDDGFGLGDDGGSDTSKLSLLSVSSFSNESSGSVSSLPLTPSSSSESSSTTSFSGGWPHSLTSSPSIPKTTLAFDVLAFWPTANTKCALLVSAGDRNFANAAERAVKVVWRCDSRTSRAVAKSRRFLVARLGSYAIGEYATKYVIQVRQIQWGLVGAVISELAYANCVSRIQARDRTVTIVHRDLGFQE